MPTQNMLEEVSSVDALRILKHKLLFRLPETHAVCCMIETKIRYPDLQLRVFTKQEHAADFVVVTRPFTSKYFQSLHIYFDYEAVSENVAVQLLKTLSDWNWKKPFLAAIISPNVAAKFNQLVKHPDLASSELSDQQLTSEGLYLYDGSKGVVQSMPPSGFKFGPLHTNKIAWIFSKWKFWFTEDTEQFQKNVEILPSVAVYEDGQVEDHPVSWILQYSYGLIGLTNTLPDFRRKGLATAVTKELISKLTAKGQQALLMIEEGNEASVAFHTNLGFRKVFHSQLSAYFPSKYSDFENFLTDIVNNM